MKLSKKRLSLGIVQTHPTQFDDPLFKYIEQRNDFDLWVYYTKTNASQLDPEVGCSPNWNDTLSTGYRSCQAINGFYGHWQLLFKIIKNKHDLVIFSGYRSFFYFFGPYICRLLGVRVGLRSDNILYNENHASIKWRVKRWVMPHLLKIYTTVNPVGSLAAEYLKSFGVSPDKIFLFPYTIDADDFRRQYQEQLPLARARKEAMGIPENSFVILGVMKFVPREDPFTLLRAYAKLTAEYKRLHLILVGSGDLDNSIREFIAKNFLTQVHLTGYVQYKDLAGYYSISDLFIHPATTESWGVSVHEALACGVPVIVSDRVGAVADLVLPADCGMVFKAGDADGLVAQMEAAITDKKMLLNLSENSKKAIKNWSLGNAVKKLYECLSVVSDPKKGWK